MLVETSAGFPRAVTELTDDPERGAELGRQTVIERYDWTAIGERFAGLTPLGSGLT